MIVKDEKENTFPPQVKKYLERNKNNTWKVEINGKHLFNAVVVIPAIMEYENIPRLFNSLIELDNKYFDETLFLFVINNGPTANKNVKHDNQKALTLLRNVINRDNQTDSGKQIKESGINIGLVDAASPGMEMPDKFAGVGLARKIGMDLALTFFDYKSKRQKIIICLDADCTVEKNYLTEIVNSYNRKNINAAVVKYKHLLPENEVYKNSIIDYEIFLRYYVLGLKYARSPYSFHTVGSTVTCNYESYIKAGGMNRKKAGEDFYFLEKLAKNVSINSINGTIVYPGVRKSWRVPFGTGKSITKCLTEPDYEMKLYSFECFIVLKKWIELFYYENIFHTEEIIKKAEKIDPSLEEFLVEHNFVNDWKNIISNSKTEAQVEKQKSLWFDGFRTFKLIHYLRDKKYPNKSIKDAAAELLFLYSKEKEDLEINTRPGNNIEILEVFRCLT
jgi:hypothetical protein